MNVKNRYLDRNLPVASPLREYLAQKMETGRVEMVPRSAEFVRRWERHDAWPRTLLVMPPIALSEGTIKRVIPPLGLCYIGASLESQGIPFDLLDCIVEGLDRETLVGDRSWNYGLHPSEIKTRINKYSPDILGLSVLYSSDLRNAYEIARMSKQINPQITVIVGGLHPSIYAKEVLRDSLVDGVPSIDFVVRGEGERRLVEFIRNYREGVFNRNADGLAGWHDGAQFVNPQFSTISDLDSLPFPAYHKLPIEKYLDFNVPFSPFPRGSRVMQVYTSRGCPVGCTFCASTNFNKSYRTRSVENVMMEIGQLRTNYGIDEIQFADDNLTLDRQRALSLCLALAEDPIPWCTPNGIMVNTLDKELLAAMVDSGLYQITLSIDSGNVKTLKERHRKPVNLNRLPGLMRYLKERGVLVHGTLVIGMPGETRQDIEDGFQFVERLAFDSIAVFIAQALPGSELYEVSIATGSISSAAARNIDTARAAIKLDHMTASELEGLAAEFLYRYNVIIRERDPGAWERKYVSHFDRLKKLCIGNAAPNTDGVIRALTGTS